MLPSQYIFHRFANTFKGHVSCSQELEDCEQKRVNINCFYPFYNLAFSFPFISFLPLTTSSLGGWTLGFQLARRNLGSRDHLRKLPSQLRTIDMGGDHPAFWDD